MGRVIPGLSIDHQEYGRCFLECTKGVCNRFYEKESYEEDRMKRIVRKKLCERDCTKKGICSNE